MWGDDSYLNGNLVFTFKFIFFLVPTCLLERFSRVFIIWSAVGGWCVQYNEDYQGTRAPGAVPVKETAKGRPPPAQLRSRRSGGALAGQHSRRPRLSVATRLPVRHQLND